MEDELKHEEDYRVTFKYKKTNSAIWLHNIRDVDYDKCDFEGATHVITELRHGFDAYLVFEKTIANRTNRRVVGGESLKQSCFTDHTNTIGSRILTKLFECRQIKTCYR